MHFWVVLSMVVLRGCVLNLVFVVLLVPLVLQMTTTSLAGRSWVEKVSTESIEIVRRPRSARKE